MVYSIFIHYILQNIVYIRLYFYISNYKDKYKEIIIIKKILTKPLLYILFFQLLA